MRWRLRRSMCKIGRRANLWGGMEEGMLWFCLVFVAYPVASQTPLIVVLIQPYNPPNHILNSGFPSRFPAIFVQLDLHIPDGGAHRSRVHRRGIGG